MTTSDSLRNVLVVGDVVYAKDPSLGDVIVECAGAIDWDAVMFADEYTLFQQLQAAIGPDFEVAEYISSRSPHPLPRALHALFPDATRILTGDSLGMYNVFPEHAIGLPQYDRVVAPIPQRLLRDTDDVKEVDVVPRSVVTEVLSSVRDANPELRAVDRDLAEFVRGGVLAVLVYGVEGGDLTLTGEIALMQKLVLRHCAGHTRILLKQHPRASVGQAAALARKLREDGHSVRLFPAKWARYPLELFSELLTAPRVIDTTLSSSLVSVAYLAGRRCAKPLSWWDALRLLPHCAPAQRRLIANFNAVVDTLLQGRADFPISLPPVPRMTNTRRAVAFTPQRVLRWYPADIVTVDHVAGSPSDRSIPSAVCDFLGVATQQQVAALGGDRWPMTWYVQGSGADDAMLNTIIAAHRAGDPLGAISQVASPLQRYAPLRFVLEVQVNPAFYAPGWYVLTGHPVCQSKPLATAEEIETVLEDYAEVWTRVPELAESWRRFRRRAAYTAPHTVLFCGLIRSAGPMTSDDVRRPGI